MTGQSKICPKCQMVAPLATGLCRNCGHIYRTRFPQDTGQPQVVAPPQALPTVKSEPTRSNWKHVFWVAPVMLFGFWNMATRTDTDESPQLQGIKTPISSVRLDDDYHSNLFAADSEYKDKLMTLEGPVKEIGKTNDGYPYVVLYGSEEDQGILCVFGQGAENALSQLSVNGRARIIGQCRGKEDDAVVIGGCVLPKQETHTIIPPDPQGSQKAMAGME